MKSLAARISIILFLAIIGSNATRPAHAAEKPGNSMSASTFEGLRFRSIGPAVTSGRIIDFAVNTNDRSYYFVAVASGGVWKTTNAGTTWIPVFDNEASYSIGCVTLDPHNPSVVWVGTGENNSQRSVSYGSGVYRSEDGGKNWENKGLKTSEHIGKILIDPRNSHVIYVAAQGPLWAPGGDRGLYKTTDDGKTWNAILTISKNTGVTDVVMDPRDSNVLYVAAYQRRRHVWTMIDGGPESAIYKTVDGGSTWKKLTNGIPTEDLGRIGLAISPVNPDVVYATIEAANKKGGFFRSVDRGANWDKQSEYVSGSPQYYSEIFPDPGNVDRVYAMDVYLMVTDDAGKTFHRLGEKNKHVDNHAMWIDPDNTNCYLVGCDGGIYESFDRGATWNFKSNLPVTQFYRVAVDNTLPFYYVYGGTQDNFSLGGPSRTTDIAGVTNADWYVTVGGDGFVTRVDPEDPNTVYSESQYGGLVRYDKRSGENLGIQPSEEPGDAPYHWNWDSPLIISSHSHTRLYFAANKVFRSDDRGDSWRVISPDLTRGLDRNKLPVMDKIWGADAVAKSASTSLYGNITCLAESPLKEGLLYAGTDNGLIQVTEDGGGHWQKLDRFPGVPEMAYVSRLETSHHEANTVFAAFDNHKMGDFAPYLLKSMNAGKSWTSIKGNLPDSGTVYAIVEDHVNRDLLFTGTEFGVYFTIDGGNHWVRLKGGLPTIAVRDIAIQKRENDLVLGTFGRGFYILDDYTPLRLLKPETLEKASDLFPVKKAPMFVPTRHYGLRGISFQGESFYAADNPPFGAVFTYYLKEALKTKKEIRQEAEKEAAKKGETPPYPTPEQLRAEDNEEPSSIILTVADEVGNVVRRITGPTTKGMHRVAWDLRYAAPTPTQLSTGEEDPFSDGGAGRPVPPGPYKVALAKQVNGILTELGGPESFSALPLGTTGLPAADLKALAAFQKKVAELQRAVLGTARAADEVKDRLKFIKKAIQETPAPMTALRDQVNSFELQLDAVIRALRGDRSLRSRNEGTLPSITERVDGIVGDEWRSTAPPTGTHIRAYEIAAKEFTPQLTKLTTLIQVDLKKIESTMEQAGSPWTPGRIPDWKQQ